MLKMMLIRFMGYFKHRYVFDAQKNHCSAFGSTVCALFAPKCTLQATRRVLLTYK